MWSYLVLYYNTNDDEVRDYRAIPVVANNGTEAYEKAQAQLGDGYRVSQVITGLKVDESDELTAYGNDCPSGACEV